MIYDRLFRALQLWLQDALLFPHYLPAYLLLQCMLDAAHMPVVFDCVSVDLLSCWDLGRILGDRLQREVAGERQH